MDRTDPDTLVIVAGIVISLVALLEVYSLLQTSKASASGLDPEGEAGTNY